jgi:hypothetical protein
MRNLSLALAALLLSASIAAAQNAPAPRIDGEGINMDAAPAPTKEPHHPAGRDHWAGRDADELAPPPEQASPNFTLRSSF